MNLASRLIGVTDRIARAAVRSGRTADEITLVSVTKSVPAATIRELVSLGVRDIGEGRIQEAREKQVALGSRLKAEGKASHLGSVRWHLVGHLQSNKAKLAAALFDVVHSIDSRAIAEVLSQHRLSLNRSPLDVFVQVNTAGESQKHGVMPTEAADLARAVAALPGLSLRGLMAIPPLSENPESVRPHFSQLRQLRDDLVGALSLEPRALSLSMGMSQDFEVAIEEGADIVRIGTAIVGERGVAL